MVRNFLFHRVNPLRDPLWDPMDVKLFERCIKYLSEKYQVVLFEDIAFSKKLLERQNKYATIMFDDGYKDNVKYALPILEKYNVKASFYVVTDCIDRNVPTWTYILEHLFKSSRSTDLSLPFNFLPTEYQFVKFADVKSRLAFVSILKPYLKTISHDQREQVLNKVLKEFSDVQIPKLMMNWNDLNELRNLGHYVGSHTKTHSMLGTMKDDEEIEKELKYSRARISKELGYAPLSISYPVGSYDERVMRISERAGYKIGLAVKQDVYDPSKEGLFEVSRIELYNETWFKTKLRISNSLEKIKKIIRYK